MRKKTKKSSKTSKNKPSVKKRVLSPKEKRRLKFVKLLIKLSIKNANESHGVIKDIFLRQALRLDAELEQLEKGDDPHKTLTHGNA